MIKVNKLFSSQHFLKEIEYMLFLFLSSYRNTRKMLWKHSPVDSCFHSTCFLCLKWFQQTDLKWDKPEPNQVCSSLPSTVLESHLFWKDMRIQLDTLYSFAALLCCMYHLHILSLALMRCLDNEILEDTMYRTINKNKFDQNVVTVWEVLLRVRSGLGYMP